MIKTRRDNFFERECRGTQRGTNITMEVNFLPQKYLFVWREGCFPPTHIAIHWNLKIEILHLNSLFISFFLLMGKFLKIKKNSQNRTASKNCRALGFWKQEIIYKAYFWATSGSWSARSCNTTATNMTEGLGTYDQDWFWWQHELPWA